MNNPNLRPTQRTPITLLDAAKTIQEVLDNTLLTSNPQATAKLLAQAILETGRFRSCWNHNWGNVKRAPTQGPYYMIRCSEIINGKEVWFDPPHPQTCFAHYDSHVQGATQWAKLILTAPRYARARAKLLNPDVSAYDFAFTLGECGYYTATQTRYSKAVQAIFNIALVAVGNSLPPPKPKEETPLSNLT